MVVKAIKSVISNSTQIFKGLCTPAKVEAILGIVGTISVLIACLTNSSGSKLQVACTDAFPYVIVSSILVYILNALCKGGAKFISWILVLTPLALILLSIFFINPPKNEGFEDYSDDDEDFDDDDDDEMFNDELFEDEEQEQEQEQEEQEEEQEEEEQEPSKDEKIASLKERLTKMKGRHENWDKCSFFRNKEENCSTEKKDNLEKRIGKVEKELKTLEGDKDEDEDEGEDEDQSEAFRNFGQISL